MLAVLSTMLVGTVIRGLQTAALLPAAPVSWFPDKDWLQRWFGLFPVAEAPVAQGLVAEFLLAGWLIPRGSIYRVPNDV